MKFGTVPIQQAEGKILAHNVAGADGHNAFRKGKRLSAVDASALARMGCQSVYVVEMESGDVDENSAARRIAQAAVAGNRVGGETDAQAAVSSSTADCGGLRIQGHSEGRVNLVSLRRGLLQVDASRLEQVNACNGVTFATLRSYSVVEPDQTVATVKIIPYALPLVELEQTLQVEHGITPLIQVQPFRPRRVGIVYSGSDSARGRVIHSFGPALIQRVEALESQVEAEVYVPWLGTDDERALADALNRLVERGVDLILMAGETSTMDANDLIPCAVSGLGGEIACVGAPIEPGNLVMLAYLGEVPLLNVPGCIRSPNPTPVDKILAALAAGERLNRLDIIRMGHGGLMQGGQHGA